MPRRTSAAKRYAEAVAAIAEQSGSWQRWQDDLHRLDQVVQDDLVRMTLESPRVAPERKEQLLRTAIGAAVAPETHNLIAVMARKGRLDLLADVVTWFDELSDAARGVVRIGVTSAVPLTEDERRQFRQQVAARRAASEVVLTETVDPGIIGGLIVQEGDIIRDYSVRARLASLRERLN
jgi:F-type H+-transporting ATPase subunit delta